MGANLRGVMEFEPAGYRSYRGSVCRRRQFRHVKFALLVPSPSVRQRKGSAKGAEAGSQEWRAKGRVFKEFGRRTELKGGPVSLSDCCRPLVGVSLAHVEAIL
jgi:hypothetical protein